MAVPEKKVVNSFYETLIDTTDEWIQSRTGIKTRYHTEQDEFTSHLCVKAVQDMVERYRVNLDDVDMIIVSTVTPD